jgi:hypothetical protein
MKERLSRKKKVRKRDLIHRDLMTPKYRKRIVENKKRRFKKDIPRCLDDL